MVSWDQHRSPADCARTLAAIEIDMLAIRERAPLDDDRIDVAENPESLAPWLFIVAVAKSTSLID